MGTTDYDELESECENLIKKKDELNGLTPQLESRWYNKLIEEKGYDAVHWDRQSLEEMQKGDFN